MKKVGEHLKKTFFLLLSIPILIIGLVLYFILFIIPAPVELISYRKSFYFRETGKKFRLGLTSSHPYQAFNGLKRLGLQLKVQQFPKRSDVIFHQVEEETALLFPIFLQVRYQKTSGLWEATLNSKTPLFPLRDVLFSFRDAYGFSEDAKVVFCVDKKKFSDDKNFKIEDFSGIPELLLYEDPYDIYETLIPPNSLRISRTDFEKTLPVRFWILFASCGFLLSIPALLMPFFSEGWVVLLLGIVVGLTLCFLAFLMVDNSRLYKKKLIRLPFDMVRWIAGLGYFMLIYQIIDLFGWFS